MKRFSLVLAVCLSSLIPLSVNQSRFNDYHLPNPGGGEDLAHRSRQKDPQVFVYEAGWKKLANRVELEGFILANLWIELWPERNFDGGNKGDIFWPNL